MLEIKWKTLDLELKDSGVRVPCWAAIFSVFSVFHVPQHFINDRCGVDMWNLIFVLPENPQPSAPKQTLAPD